MRYRDFIAELRGFVAEAQRLKKSGVTHDDPGFREWRHRTESLVRTASQHGYQLPGNYSSSRRFYTDPYHASKDSEAAALAKDVGDSEIELRCLIEQYEKYGDPPLVSRVAASTTAAGLDVPDRVTISWLLRNVSITGWLSAAGILLLVFLVGVGVGRTAWYTSMEAWIRTNFGG